ncbi:methyltransferase-like protein 24 [Pecten maximus]|uniref:methyltransferase-like protein 24 n=1 Tax=Pecten maximus TaxID=6579 RepID=UPI00145836CA|nr:methyltransferase-like protein 24 [Pecten maximus]
MKMAMNIPVEILNCANKAVTKPYNYDYKTEFYLPPPVSDLCRMSLPDLEYLYQRYLNTIQTVCKTPRRFGKITDGGWDVCVEPQYLPSKGCLVYSFGINNDFSFDDEIADSHNCEVHSFDPSMKVKSHIRRKSRTFFHDTGLSDVSRTNPVGTEWRMLTFKDIRTDLNHSERMPDVVKMDIEVWEWNVLPEMFATGQFPRQLIIEFHLWSQRYTTQKDMWIRRLSVLRLIHDAGYRIFWMNRNLICKYKSVYTKKQTLACHEISLIRNGPDVLTDY